MLGHSVKVFISQCTYFAPHTEYYIDFYLSKAEVTDLNVGAVGVTGGEEDVFRFDVAVHDTLQLLNEIQVQCESTTVSGLSVKLFISQCIHISLH